jgi:hypothetical protein
MKITFIQDVSNAMLVCYMFDTFVNRLNTDKFSSGNEEVKSISYRHV